MMDIYRKRVIVDEDNIKQLFRYLEEKGFLWVDGLIPTEYFPLFDDYNVRFVCISTHDDMKITYHSIDSIEVVSMDDAISYEEDEKNPVGYRGYDVIPYYDFIETTMPIPEITLKEVLV